MWIIEQVEAQFGSQGKYLVDFYHLCDYWRRLARSSQERINPPGWRKKKDWLKDNSWKDVLEALRPSLEAAIIPASEVPVRACFPHISNHYDFLDYKGALAAGLPIGSGEIESDHRYVSRSQGRGQLVEGGKPAAFAVASMQRWWRMLGKNHYPKAKRLLICADAGGSTGIVRQEVLSTYFPNTSTARCAVGNPPLTQVSKDLPSPGAFAIDSHKPTYPEGMRPRPFPVRIAGILRLRWMSLRAR